MSQSKCHKSQLSYLLFMYNFLFSVLFCIPKSHNKNTTFFKYIFIEFACKLLSSLLSCLKMCVWIFLHSQKLFAHIPSSHEYTTKKKREKEWKREGTKKLCMPSGSFTNDNELGIHIHWKRKRKRERRKCKDTHKETFFFSSSLPHEWVELKGISINVFLTFWILTQKRALNQLTFFYELVF